MNKINKFIQNIKLILKFENTLSVNFAGGGERVEVEEPNSPSNKFKYK